MGSVENLIDGADGVQSLRLDGRKVCNIKRVGISQAESNKATVCALPSIQLPLTRDGHGCPKLNAQRLCTDAKPTERSYGKGGSAERGVVRFWEGWTEREGARQLISFSIITSAFTKYKIHSVSPYRSIHVLTASMPNKRSFRCYSRRLLYQSCKGAVYSSFQTQASVCRTAV